MKATKTATEETSAADFFAEWAIYRKIVDRDYMNHAAVADQIGKTLGEAAGDGGLSVLELACGDAEIALRLAEAVSLRSYDGVDLSEMALKLAVERFHESETPTRFHCADNGDFLLDTRERFDVIVANFALHHLKTREEKITLFELARIRLAPHGLFLVMDVFLDPGDGRESFHDWYLEWIRREWTELTESERERIEGHVRECDYPESVACMKEIALEAGFQGIEEAWKASHGAHRIMHFWLR